MIPETIDRYEIKAECGRGAMAIVYQAYDPQYKREVALKVLPREFLHDKYFRERFRREIDIMKTLRHPRVVPIYGYGQFQAQLYIVMQFMPGGSLEDRVFGKGPVPGGEVAALVTKIASVLDTAHQQGIVHRDMKPSNILFDGDGEPFVGDFGIARIVENTSRGGLTGTELLGTPAYMSPEQARTGVKVDGRGDIYSLGVILFELLTGEIPFYAEQPMQLALKHLIDPVPDVLAVNPSLPRAVKPVMTKVLAKEPNDRFQTAGELAAALSAALLKTPSTPPRKSEPPSKPLSPAKSIPPPNSAPPPKPASSPAQKEPAPAARFNFSEVERVYVTLRDRLPANKTVLVLGAAGLALGALVLCTGFWTAFFYLLKLLQAGSPSG